MLNTMFPFKLATAALALELFAFAPAGAADAGPRPALKAEASVVGAIVRVGDLVENAGASAEIAIFRAPDLGQTGAVPVDRVLDAVRAHQIVDVDTRGLREIAVSRASRAIGRKEIEARILAALAERQGLGAAHDISFAFDREPRPMETEPTDEPRLARASFEPRSGRFDVSFEGPASGNARRPSWRYSGTLVETVEIATLIRTVARGDVIRASDIAMERKPKALTGDSTLRSAEQIVGLAARRNLQPNQPLRAADVMKPEIVRANETITILYEVPGIALTARGKALESGAEGDVVNVLNVQSKRTLQGTVVGSGRVSVAPLAAPAAAAAALPSPQPTSLAAAMPPQRAE